jgi:hypothetical protein
MADLDGARFVADADEASVRVDVTMTPSQGNAGPAKAVLASMRTGDALPLLGDVDSPLAVLVRDDAAGRAQTAGALEGALAKALASRLEAPEEKKLKGALEGWAKARGDWMTFGLVGTDGLYVRAAAQSEASADRAVKDVLDLLGAPPFKEILRIHSVKVGQGAATVTYGEQKGDEGSAPKARVIGAPKRADVAWSAKNGEIAATVQGTSAKQAPARKLGDDPGVAGEVKALGADVTFAAVAQPLKLDPVKSLLPAAPLVLAWGKKGNDLWAHAEANDALVRELLRSRMGL